jgi:acyl-CoA thioesterase
MTTHPTLSLLSQPHPLHTSITFLSRCTPGGAKLVASTLKTGRQYTFVRVALHQHDVVCLAGTIIFTHLTRLQKGISLRTLPTAPLPSRDGPWVVLSDDPLHEVRPVSKKLLYRVHSGTCLGSKKESPSLREQWVKMADGSRFGISSLGYLSDMFVPVPENYDETGDSRWYPTLALSLEVKRVPPEDGWGELFCRIESKVIEDGRMDITVEIFDVEGGIVAISHHVAIIVDAARNRTSGPRL